ncbi:MAG: tandem-95 repeat protein [Pseudomonadota bacterium]
MVKRTGPKAGTARKTAIGVGGLVGLGGLVIGAGGGAYAGPQGGVVTSGQAAIQRQGALTTITQGTDRAALQWQSFDIGAGETVRFRQPSTSSIALNTILDRKPTEIRGNLTSNGQVWLQNPQGVIFTETSAVDVGGLLATTARIDEAAFAEGRGRVEGAGGQGAVINRGAIQAGEGGVALIAPIIENTGVIEVAGGSADLAAATGFSVDTHGDGLLSIVVDAADAEQLSLINEGTIRAEGGVVRLSAAQAEGVQDSLVHAGGIVEATGIEDLGGAIVITGGETEGGVALVTGEVTATRGAMGGEIAVNGAEVRLEQGAQLSVSAPEGGGLIEIGPRAAPVPPKRIAVVDGATLAADATAATGRGDAGRIEFWSTDATDFQGSASASSAGFGDGGFVDISSAGELGFNGTVLTESAFGAPGELLFDPLAILIGVISTNDGEITDGNIGAGEFPGATLYISAAALNARTASAGSTTLQATDLIRVNSALTVTGGHTLTLEVSTGGTSLLYISNIVNMGPGAVFNGNADTVNVTSEGSINFIGADTFTYVNLNGPTAVNVPLGIGNDFVTLTTATTIGNDVNIMGGDIGIYRGVRNNGGNLNIDATGTLTMDGDIFIRPDVDNITLTAGGTATLSGSTLYAASLTIESDDSIFVTGSQSISGTMTLQELTAGGGQPTISVTGATIDVDGAVTLAGSAVGLTSDNFSAGSLDVDASAGAGDVNAPGTFAVTGNVDIDATTVASFDIPGSYSVSVGGDLTIDTGGAVTSTARFDNSSYGIATVGPDLLTVNAGAGSAVLEGPITIGGAPDGPITVTGGTSVTVYGTLTSDGTFTANGGDLVVDLYGGTGEILKFSLESIGGDVTLNADGNLTFNDFDGDVSSPLVIASNLFANAGTDMGETLAVNGDITITQSGTFTGRNIDISGDDVEVSTGTTALVTGIDTVLINGSFNSGGVATISATGTGGTVDIITDSFTVGGADIDAPGAIDIEVSSFESDGNVTIDSTGGMVTVEVDAGDADGVITGSLSIRTPSDIEFRPLDLSVSSDLTLASNSAVTLYNYFNESSLEFDLRVGQDFTIEPNSGGGAPVITIDQYFGTELDIYVARDFSVTSGGSNISIDASFDGGSAGGYYGVGGNFTLNGGTTGAVVLQDTVGAGFQTLVAGDVDIDGASLSVESSLARTGNLGIADAGTIDIDTVGLTIIGLQESPPLNPSFAGSMINPYGNITIDADGVRLGSDVIAGTSGVYNGTLSVTSDSTIFVESSATIEAGQVEMTATDGFAQATLVGAGLGTPLTIVANGTTATPATPNLVIEADSIEVFGTVTVTGDAELTATGDFPEGVAGNDTPGTSGLIFVGPQPAGAITGALTSQTTAPGTTGAIAASGDITLVAGANQIEGAVTSTSVDTDGTVSITSNEDFAYIDSTVSGELVRVYAPSGTIVIEAAAAISASDAVSGAVPHPLMLRAAEFFVDLDASVSAPGVLIGFTGSEASVGGSESYLPDSQFGVLAGAADEVTVLSNAGDGNTGPTTLTIYDISAPSSGLERLAFGAGDQIYVEGNVSGGGAIVPGDFGTYAVGGFTVELGTRIGLYGNTTNHVPTNIDVSGRVGVLPDDGYFTFEPADGILFTATDSVTTSTGLTDSSLIFYAAGTSVIDVGDAFIMENTTGAASPITDGVPSAGAIFESLRIDSAARTDIFGTVNAMGGADARLEVEIGSGFTPNALTQINDCVIAASSCVLNGTPTGDPIFGATDEDTPSDPIDVLDGFSDPDGDPLELVEIDGQDVDPGDTLPGPDGGVLIVGEDGTVVFDPQDDFNTLMVGDTVSFDVTVTVTDGDGGTASDTLTVTVTGVNDAPTAMDADIATDQNTIADPLGVDEVGMDIDMDALGFSEINGEAVMPGDTVFLPGQGTITIASDGSLIYSPAGEITGGDPETPVTFTVPVTVTDGNGGFADAIITIAVATDNAAPIGMMGSISTDEDMASAFLDAVGLFEDPEMQALELVAVDGSPVTEGSRVAGPEGGTIVVGENGQLFFDPGSAFLDLNGGETESFTFDVTVADAFGARGTATVAVSVIGIGDLILLLPGEIATTEDMASDPLGLGTLAGEGVTGGLSVEAVNGQNVSTGAGVDLDDGGSLIVGADGTLVFDPGEDFQGLMEGASDSFSVTLTLSDETGATGTTPVAIDVSGLNDDPNAPMGLIETTEDMISAGLSPEALGMDPDMDALVVSEIGGVAVEPGSQVPLGDGVLIIDGDGNLFFDPAGNFDQLGMDDTAMLSVDLTVVDPFGAAATGTLTVNVLGLDGGLVGMDGTIATTEDVAGTLTPDQLADDPDMGEVSIIAIDGGGTGAVDLPEGGRLFVDGSGNLIFDPGDDFQSLAAGQPGPVQTVSVTLRDTGGDEATADVTITVAGLNDNPVGGEGMLQTTEDAPTPGFGTLGVVEDVDDGAVLQVIAVNGTQIDENGVVELEMGTVTVAPDGTLVFDPAGDFESLQVGEADMLELSVGVIDNQGGLGEVTVEVDVTGLNDAPVAVDDGPVDSSAVATTTVVVLDNDFDPEDDPIRVISVSDDVTRGSVTIGEDGVLIFDPGLDFLDLGEAELVEFSVDYEITDGLDGFDTGQASFQVSGVGANDLGDLIEIGVLPPEIISYPVGFVDDEVIDSSVLTPNPEVTFGFFNEIGIIAPTLEEEDQVTNRADDEAWPGVQ